MKTFMKCFAFVLFFAFFGSVSSAQAYIDPATTSYLLEGIIALVVMGGAVVGFVTRKIKNKVRKNNAEIIDNSLEDQLSGLDDEEDED